MAGMVTNPMSQLQSQGIQNQAIQSQIGMQNFMDNVMKGYLSIANSPSSQNNAIDYLQGTRGGVGGLSGGLLSNMNAADAVIPGGAPMNPAVANQVLGALQPSLNKEASGALYSSLGLPFGAHIPGLSVPGSQQIQSNGMAGAGMGLGYMMGTPGGGGGSGLDTGGVSLPTVWAGNAPVF